LGPRAGLDVCEKSRPPPGFDPRTVQQTNSSKVWTIKLELSHEGRQTELQTWTKLTGTVLQTSFVTEAKNTNWHPCHKRNWTIKFVGLFKNMRVINDLSL
jgi:hypothetical protein